MEESDEYTEKMPDYGEILKFVGFPTYKIHVNVVRRILALYDVFDLSLSFVDRYFFVQHGFSIVFVVEFLTKA